MDNKPMTEKPVVKPPTVKPPAPSTTIGGGPNGGMPQNLTPEQVEAFRQQMRDRFSKGRGPDGATDGRTRGDAPTTSKTPKNTAPAPTTPNARTLRGHAT